MGQSNKRSLTKRSDLSEGERRSASRWHLWVSSSPRSDSPGANLQTQTCSPPWRMTEDDRLDEVIDVWEAVGDVV